MAQRSVGVPAAPFGARSDRPARAAALMLASLCALGLHDAFVKLVSDTVSVWQFQALRAVAHLALLAALVGPIWRGAPVWPKRPGAVVLRSLCLMVAVALFFAGMPVLGLAEVAAGLYVFPLFVTALSALLLGERVGPRRALAVGVGFVGAIAILRPGGDALGLAALLPLVAAVFYAATILITRSLCRDEHPATLALGAAVAFLVSGGLGMLAADLAAPASLAAQAPFVFEGWRGLEGATLGLIAFCAALSLATNIGLAIAYQSAEPSWLAPFDYSYLVFATLWGAVVFAERPDALSLLGMAMIAGSGSYVAWRDRRESRIRRADANRLLR